MKILVTHAGMSGPATIVAERIARVMTGLGADVTLLPMTGVATVKGYLGELLNRGQIEFFVRDHAGWWRTLP